MHVRREIVRINFTELEKFEPQGQVIQIEKANREDTLDPSRGHFWRLCGLNFSTCNKQDLTAYEHYYEQEAATTRFVFVVKDINSNNNYGFYLNPFEENLSDINTLFDYFVTIRDILNNGYILNHTDESILLSDHNEVTKKLTISKDVSFYQVYINSLEEFINVHSADAMEEEIEILTNLVERPPLSSLKFFNSKQNPKNNKNITPSDPCRCCTLF